MEKETHIFSDKLKPYVCLYLCMQSLKGNILESVLTILCVPLNLPFYLFILNPWVKLILKNTAVVIAKKHSSDIKQFNMQCRKKTLLELN